MANPLLLVALGTGIGTFLTSAYLRAEQRMKAADQARQEALQMSTPSLETNKAYMLQAIVDPKLVPLPPSTGTPSIDNYARMLQADLSQYGWLLNPPQIRDQAAASRFLAGQTAEWILSGRWNRPERFMASKPAWLLNAAVTPLPTA